MIQVDGGGSATAVVAGLTIDGGRTDADPPARTAGDLTLGMIGTYYIAGTGDNAPAVAVTDTNAPNDNIPHVATGRDNEYYTYSVTITPNSGVTGDLIISVKQFEDHVKPVSNAVSSVISGAKESLQR